MDNCGECGTVFIKGGIRTDAQRIVGSGRHPNLQYCPSCNVAYSLDGSLLQMNGNGRVYFDAGYISIPERGVVQWGRLVTDRSELTARKK